MDISSVVDKITTKAARNRTEDTMIKDLETEKLTDLSPGNEALGLSGSFCTEVRSLHLSVVNKTPDDEKEQNNSDHKDRGSTHRPNIDIQSASESDTDDETGPPPKKLQHDGPLSQKERPISPKSESKNTERQQTLGKNALTLTASLTPEDVAKRLEELEVGVLSLILSLYLTSLIGLMRQRRR